MWSLRLLPKRWAAAGAIGFAYLHTCKYCFNFTTMLGCLPWRPWCDFIEPGFDGAEFDRSRQCCARRRGNDQISAPDLDVRGCSRVDAFVHAQLCAAT